MSRVAKFSHIWLERPCFAFWSPFCLFLSKFDGAHRMHAWQQDVLCSAWRQEEPVAKTQKWSTLRQCSRTSPSPVQYIPQWPAEKWRHPKLHIRRRFWHQCTTHWLHSCGTEIKPWLSSRPIMRETTSVQIHPRRRCALSTSATVKQNVNWRWPGLEPH